MQRHIALLADVLATARRASAAASPVLCRSLHTSGAAAAADAWGAPPAAPQRRVVITGIGLVTPLGVGTERTWARVVSGETAVRALRAGDLPEGHGGALEQLPSRVVACVPRDELAASEWAPDGDARRLSPFTTFALAAAKEALYDAEWLPCSDAARQRTGVAIGAGISCTSDIADAGVLLEAGKLRRLSPYFIPRVLMNMPAGMVSITFGLQGPCHATATACAAGAHAIGDAFQMVRRGDADVMVAGGTESCIDAVSLGGFARLRALSTAFNDDPAAASRPFDAARDGFVLGEGAAVLVLEEMGHAEARGAHAYAEIRGYGMSGDAYHMTQPPADGAGAATAMRRALASSGLCDGDVSYINAHATSTPIGDDVEQHAIAAVFGDRATGKRGAAIEAAEQPPLLVSSTKGATGHLLGAAGAVEAALTVLALSRRIAPPTVNLETPSPALLAGLVHGRVGGAQLPAAGPVAALNNSFGFGGTNASLLFASPPEGC